MKLNVEVTNEDIALVEKLLAQQSGKSVVRSRRAQNLAPHKSPVTPERFWRALICMRLTSRQKSGPGSAIANLKKTEPFSLELQYVRDHSSDVETFIRKTLESVKGLRDYNIAATQFANAFTKLEDGLWRDVLVHINALTKESSVDEERFAADYLDQNFSGIGPKQSRNILQALGLTRFEIPLDSRVMKWLTENLDFPVPLNTQLLADKTYYHIVLNVVQTLCQRCNVFPCILDASIFAASDPDTWTEKELIY